VRVFVALAGNQQVTEVECYCSSSGISDVGNNDVVVSWVNFTSVLFMVKSFTHSLFRADVQNWDFFCLYFAFSSKAGASFDLPTKYVIRLNRDSGIHVGYLSSSSCWYARALFFKRCRKTGVCSLMYRSS
jgi:hypothetical protein